MSTSLLWRPIVPVEEHTLPNQLKYRLGPRYWNHDGTLGGEPVTLSSDDLQYLAGLKDGGVEGAEELIDAINKYGAVEMWLER